VAHLNWQLDAGKTSASVMNDEMAMVAMSQRCMHNNYGMDLIDLNDPTWSLMDHSEKLFSMGAQCSSFHWQNGSGATLDTLSNRALHSLIDDVETLCQKKFQLCTIAAHATDLFSHVVNIVSCIMPVTTLASTEADDGSLAVEWSKLEEDDLATATRIANGTDSATNTAVRAWRRFIDRDSVRIHSSLPAAPPTVDFDSFDKQMPHSRNLMHFITFKHTYYGNDTVLMAKAMKQGMFFPLHLLHHDPSFPLDRMPNAAAETACLSELRDLICQLRCGRTGARNIAVLVEPFMIPGGGRRMSHSFLRRLSIVCRARDVWLIVDETLSFVRCGWPLYSMKVWAERREHPLPADMDANVEYRTAFQSANPTRFNGMAEDYDEDIGQPAPNAIRHIERYPVATDANGDAVVPSGMESLPASAAIRKPANWQRAPNWIVQYELTEEAPDAEMTLELSEDDAIHQRSARIGRLSKLDAQPCDLQTARAYNAQSIKQEHLLAADFIESSFLPDFAFVGKCTSLAMLLVSQRTNSRFRHWSHSNQEPWEVMSQQYSVVAPYGAVLEAAAKVRIIVKHDLALRCRKQGRELHFLLRDLLQRSHRANGIHRQAGESFRIISLGMCLWVAPAGLQRLLIGFGPKGRLLPRLDQTAHSVCQTLANNTRFMKLWRRVISVDNEKIALMGFVACDLCGGSGPEVGCVGCPRQRHKHGNQDCIYPNKDPSRPPPDCPCKYGL
jgi:hypothetical protein